MIFKGKDTVVKVVIFLLLTKMHLCIVSIKKKVTEVIDLSRFLKNLGGIFKMFKIAAMQRGCREGRRAAQKFC